MEINRVWAMPNKWTFKIQPIAELLKRYRVGKGWIDPFAGKYSPAQITNDLNPEMNTISHMEAHDFVEKLDGRYVGAVFDPPYSLTQVSRSYNNLGIEGWNKNNRTGAFPRVKNGISRVVKRGGFVISFGWNSVGMGEKRGFKIVEILLVSHGGNRNDTIVTVERKVNRQANLFK